jgi:hypothetical protein
MAIRALRIGAYLWVNCVTVLANAVSIGLIPGDGIGREVIPVSPMTTI